MALRQRIPAAATAVCALTCALICALSLTLLCIQPERARASATQRTILLDDDELIYSSPSHIARRLRQIAALGVDTIKVSVVWSLIAPDALSTVRPSFNASDPAAYPAGVWDRYDRIVELCRALGMRAYFQLGPPTPLWALPPHQAADQGPPLGRAPIPSQFRQFVQAVGRRYSGRYVTAVSASASPTNLLSGLPVGSSTSTSSAPEPASAAVPAVSMWGIWNEPNERSWLNPWQRNISGHRVELLQPRQYRQLVDAAYSGLSASGHQRDTILIGETANKGIWQPVPFVRALYCVGPSLAPLSGDSAAVVGCPVAADRTAFLRAHPGLFRMSGYAHHPYIFEVSPNRAVGDPNVIGLSNLPDFERTMDRILGGYGQARPGGLPIYLTEWGYKTNPPNPYVRTSLALQAAWLNEGEYMTWHDPRVRALTQFELVDSPPKPDQPPGSFLYWSSFQTGLILRTGSIKPSYNAFRIPIWLPDSRHGPRVTIWGQLRPADHTTTQYGVIEFRPAGARDWTGTRLVQTNNSEGFLLAHVALPSVGSLRLACFDPRTGAVDYSRIVTIR